MISVAQALDHVFALVTPLDPETVSLRAARGRVLSQPVISNHAQPPFPASAMDGYAVAGNAGPGDRMQVIGESAAGHGFAGAVQPGQTVRIFTGAPVPPGADRIVIQEDVTRDGDGVVLNETLDDGPYIRPAGFDFAKGAAYDPARALTPQDIALIAAMGHARVTVRRRPHVAIIATGDELVHPGTPPGPDQIVASNNLGLAAMVEAAGAVPHLLPIARDTAPALDQAFDLARGADLVITIGGASVGDHDLVAPVAAARGMERSFYKVAMRPGKPLMAGHVDGAAMIGLPGNPVSSMVCGSIFVVPALRVMMGLPAEPAPRRAMPLAAPLGKNGPREHYMRARLGPDGVTAETRQDSALLSVLAVADALIVRAPHDGPKSAGDTVPCVIL